MEISVNRLAMLSETPLCQGEQVSCAACCGTFNFADRSPDALAARLERRTARIGHALWDTDRIRAAAEELSAEEAPLLLFKAVRTCPLAGFVDQEHRRVGCMIHPLLHPSGQDLRDLGAYRDRTVCAGHLCGPHQWLGTVERAFLSCAPGWRTYSMGIGESGFVKAALKMAAAAAGGELREADFSDAKVREGCSALLGLFDSWPFLDPDPRRFGGFSFAGDDAYTRETPGAGRFADVMTPTEATALDALGTLLTDEHQARAAVGELRRMIQAVAASVEQHRARR